MKVKEAMQAALALLPIKPDQSDGLMDFAPDWVNLAMAEALECENSIRQSRGEPPLENPPSVSGLEEEIPLEERIARGPLVYALGALAAKDDGDPDWAATLRARFTGGLWELAPCTQQDTAEAMFGGDE